MAEYPPAKETCTRTRGDVLFVGEFPPPYGGVTIKDSLLVEEVFDDCGLERFDLYCFKREKIKAPWHAVRLLRKIKRARFVLIGVGHPARTCWLFRILKVIRGESFLRNTSVFMMGVGTPGYLREHPGSIPLISKGRCVFTESEQINRQFAELGCSNTRYLPNFRKGDGSCPPRMVGEIVRFVYFAQVRPEKGIETLVHAVKALNEEGIGERFDVSLYGSILQGYEAVFRDLISDVSNMTYKGVFDARGHDVYKELNQYDAAVSSSWREGMSGTNIECKFAGVANIVSDVGFNAECVHDRVDGLLVKPRDATSLANAMRQVINDRRLLKRLKNASYESRAEYDVSTWKQEVLDIVF